MSLANPDWPVLLSHYHAAVAEFNSVSRALTAALTAGHVTDEALHGLISSEEKARETVVLARIRLINLWRESNMESHDLPATGTRMPMQDR